MKFWKKDSGNRFKNSDKCFGYEYNPGNGKVDVATISIRGRFPEKGWGYLDESHEMAFILGGKGYIKNKSGDRHDLKKGDIVYIEPLERFCWGGNIDMVVTCGPAFNPEQHHIEENI